LKLNSAVTPSASGVVVRRLHASDLLLLVEAHDDRAAAFPRSVRTDHLGEATEQIAGLGPREVADRRPREVDRPTLDLAVCFGERMSLGEVRPHRQHLHLVSAGDLSGGLEQEVATDVDRHVGGGTVEGIEQQSGLETRPAAGLDQHGAGPDRVGDLLGGGLHDAQLGAGDVVLVDRADAFEQLAAAMVVVELRRQELLLGGQALEHLLDKRTLARRALEERQVDGPGGAGLDLERRGVGGRAGGVGIIVRHGGGTSLRATWLWDT
jgi:hypothetical protein